MRVLRRIYNNGQEKEHECHCKLIKKNDRSVIVRLVNGAVIKRKARDVIEW